MPLLAATLEDEILKLTDKRRADFVGFPSTAELVGANWAHAARGFFELASIPSLVILLPVAHDLAEAAMHARIVADMTLGGPMALQNGFLAYAAVLAASVLPGLGVLVSPPGPPTLPVLPPIADPVIPAIAIAAAILAWSATGTFTPATPPGSPPVPWL